MVACLELMPWFHPYDLNPSNPVPSEPPSQLWGTVLNKCLTILLNVMIWDQHAAPAGIFCLFVCIAGGMIYEQSPMRGEQKPVPTVTADDDEFKAEISGDVHNDEEMAELVEKAVSPSTGAKRRG